MPEDSGQKPKQIVLDAKKLEELKIRFEMLSRMINETKADLEEVKKKRAVLTPY